MNQKRKQQLVINGCRVVAAITIGYNAHTLITADLPLWADAILGFCIALLVWSQVMLWLGNRRLDSVVEDLRWQIAAESNDPVAALARMEYFDTLSREEFDELRQWFANAPEHDVDIDDLPPVVAGLFRIELAHPKE